LNGEYSVGMRVRIADLIAGVEGAEMAPVAGHPFTGVRGVFTQQERRMNSHVMARAAGGLTRRGPDWGIGGNATREIAVAIRIGAGLGRPIPDSSTVAVGKVPPDYLGNRVQSKMP